MFKFPKFNQQQEEFSTLLKSSTEPRQVDVKIFMIEISQKTYSASVAHKALILVCWRDAFPVRETRAKSSNKNVISF